MKKHLCPRLLVRPGSENSALGLYLGKQFEYYLIGFVEGFHDQAIVCDAKTGRVIPGINIKCFEQIPAPKMLY